MIYLITGVPGAGKTCYMVSQMLKDPDFKNRPLYVDGVNELDANAIPYIDMPEGCDGSNWHTWLPDGAILVIDECQRYWRSRPGGRAVPDAVQAMETHRHKGIDIWLLTQDANKLDSAIRGLVEVHRHFSMSKLGVRRCMEWWQKVGNPVSRVDVKSATITPYFLDETAQKHYKSSVQHNEVKAKKSLWAIFLPVFFLFGILMMLVGAYYVYKIFFSEQTPQLSKEEKTKIVSSQSTPLSQPKLTTEDNTTNGIVEGFSTQKVASEPAIKPNTLKPDDFKPAIDGQPWTAPIYAAYNGHNSIKTMPYPVACIKSTDKCTCYEEQGTPIRGMDRNLCLDFVENGIYNPYKTPDSNNISSPSGAVADISTAVNPVTPMQ